MRVESYADAVGFLEDTQAALESNEAANSLMLGVCARMARHPERVRVAPCLKTVQDEGGLVLAAMMTPPQDMVLYGHQGDLDAAARLLAETVQQEGWGVPGTMGPGQAAERFASHWGEITGYPSKLVKRLTAYELRQVLLPPPGHGQLRAATDADADLVARWWHGFDLDCFGQGDPADAAGAANRRIADGDMYLWIDARPVSMAMKNRPTTHGISVSQVYTPPEHRRKGYATACVAELSRLLLGMGYEYCGLFADGANPTANHIYQEIGYRPLCDYDEYALSAEGS